MKERGFSLVEGVLIIVVVGLIGGVGYMAYSNFLAPKADKTADAQPVKVESKKDLETVDKTLDTVSLDDVDTTDLDNVTNDL